MRLPARSKDRPTPMLVLVGSALLLLATLTPTASAVTQVKPYEFDIGLPDSVGAGTTATFQAFLKNHASTQQLGSTNLSAPSISFPTPQEITLTPGDYTLPSTATATAFSDRIELRNLGIPPGRSITFSFLASVSCAAGNPITWKPEPKQSNNWSGPAGNAFNPPIDSDFDTDVTGTCHLAFQVQPHSAEKNTTITGTDFDSQGSPVIVALLDGSNNVVTSFKDPVSLARNTVAGSGSLVGGGPVNAVAGKATFSGLQVTSAGYYTVTASAPSLSLSVISDHDPSTAANDPFAIVDDACGSGETCTVNLPTQMQVESTNTGDGFVTLIVGVGGLDCGDDFQHAPFVTEINSTDATATGTKTDTVTIYKQYVNDQPNNGAAFFQVCYQAPHTFTTRDGTPATEDPPGTFTGLLPDCASQNPQPPCIFKKSKNQAGDVVIVLLLPAGDPRHS